MSRSCGKKTTIIDNNWLQTSTQCYITCSQTPSFAQAWKGNFKNLKGLIVGSFSHCFSWRPLPHRFLFCPQFGFRMAEALTSQAKKQKTKEKTHQKMPASQANSHEMSPWLHVLMPELKMRFRVMFFGKHQFVLPYQVFPLLKVINFTVLCKLEICGFTPVISLRIVLSCFHLLSWELLNVCRLL